MKLNTRKKITLLFICLLFSAVIYAENGKKGPKKEEQDKPDKKSAVLIMRDEAMKKELFSPRWNMTAASGNGIRILKFTGSRNFPPAAA